MEHKNNSNDFSVKSKKEARWSNKESEPEGFKHLQHSVISQLSSTVLFNTPNEASQTAVNNISLESPETSSDSETDGGGLLNFASTTNLSSARSDTTTAASASSVSSKTLVTAKSLTGIVNKSFVGPFSSNPRSRDDASYASSLASENLEADGSPLPNYSLNNIGDYLRTGYWGGNERSFNLTSSGTGANGSRTLYYNYYGWSEDSNGLGADRRVVVDHALDYIGEVLGINFISTSSTATHVDLFFKDNGSGAYASTVKWTNTSAGHDTIDYTKINVSSSWNGGSDAINGYTYQTFIHEIGHAIGLGHAGDYNFSGNYVTDTSDPDYGNNSNHYLNDSWQASIMSYFDQSENTSITADHNYVISWQAGDYQALRDLYGSGYAFNGNTTYGFNTNISSGTSQVFANLATYADEAAFTIIDSDGIDTLDFSGYSLGSNIRLTVASGGSISGTISDIGGQDGNMTLGVGTVIENAKGGSGDDYIYGNQYNNVLYGNAGNDRLYGYQGSDTLYGGSGSDYIYGSSGYSGTGDTGNNYLYGNDGNDYLRGGNLNDSLYGGNGNDDLRGNDGNDYLRGDAGNDSINGGAGIDRVSYTGASSAVTVDLSTGIATGGAGTDSLTSIEDIAGSSYGDILTGNSSENTIWGNGGNDTIDGGGGNDTIYGGSGNDTLIDSSGSYNVYDGGSGVDTLVSDRNWVDSVLFDIELGKSTYNSVDYQTFS